MKKVGKIINWYKSVGSTNDVAFENSSRDADKTIYAAEFQTAGRGQKGNRWDSSAGKNLTFSILLKPSFLKAGEQYVLSMVTTLGIASYLKKKAGINKECVKIKWPNDIYVCDKKICGMLIENSISGDAIGVSIAGIGLNINQTEFAPELKNATSLALQTRIAEYDLKKELDELSDCIFYYYDKARLLAERGKGFSEIADEYLSNLYRFNEFHKFVELSEISANKPVDTYTAGKEALAKENGNVIKAKIVGITPQFCLVLSLEDGTRREYAFKEIGYII